MWHTDTEGISRHRKEDIIKTVKALIKRHPLLSYFALTFAISWGGMLLVMVAGPGGFPATPEQVETRLQFAMLAWVAGPP